MVKISFLSENKTETAKVNAEFGLSIYIENRGHRILFDTGASEMFASNAREMGIEIEKVDDVVISHGHYDHTEGVPTFVKINKTAPIHIHKEAFKKVYGYENGVLDDWSCGIWWDKKDYEDRLVLTEGVTKLYDNAYIVGNVPQLEKYKSDEIFYEKDGDGNLIQDPMMHEQFLALDEPEGLYIFSGCSHQGIISILEYAKKIFPSKKIALLVAGLHLYPASQEMRKLVCQDLSAMDIGKIMPVHCTGLIAINMLKNLIGDKCIVAAAGETYEY